MRTAAHSRITDALQPMEAAAFAAFVAARRERAVRVAYRMLAGDVDAPRTSRRTPSCALTARSRSFGAKRASIPGSTGFSCAKCSGTGAGAPCGSCFAATPRERAGKAFCLVGATVRRELYGERDPLGERVRLGKLSCEVIGTLQSKGESTFGQDQDDCVIFGYFPARQAARLDPIEALRHE